MAKITAFRKVDISNFDLSGLALGSPSFQDNVNVVINGKTYQDELRIQWNDDGQQFLSKLGGNNFAFSMNSVPVSGTVTGYFEYVSDAGWRPNLYIENISLSLVQLYNTLVTPGTSDDLALIRSIFSGNDTVIGSRFSDKLYAFAGNDKLNGRGGNDTLNGGRGADEMRGGVGNDTCIVDNRNDKVVEAQNSGTDTVRSSISFSLPAHVERLILTDDEDINGTGNSGANRIIGNSDENILNGRGGRDVLTGGGDEDVFRFNTALGANNVDTITDFKVNVDEIELDNAIFKVLGTSLTASEFVANASGTAQNGAQHILYDTTDGRLFYDADGQGGQARVHFATLKAGLALDHLDFDVI